MDGVNCASCLVLSGLVLWGCQSPQEPLPRYIVTAAPFDVAGNGAGICIGIDPVDAAGVWWWQPGPSGCSTSILRPIPVMRAEGARVNAFDDAHAIDVAFKIQLAANTYRDIKLTVKDNHMQDIGSDLRVATERRHDLRIPKAYGR